MRFFSTALFAFTALSALVFAQENPITAPTAGDELKAGDSTTITWTPTTSDENVELVLRKGDSDDLDTITTIGNVPNTGTYTWTVPEDTPAGSDYAIEIKYEGGSNFSPQFGVDSTVVGTTSATTGTVTTTAETSSTETESATTETTTTEATTTEATTTEASNSTTVMSSTVLTSTTATANLTSTTRSSTTTTRRSQATDDLDDGDAPSAASVHSFSLALLLCVGAAGVYLL